MGATEFEFRTWSVAPVVSGRYTGASWDLMSCCISERADWTRSNHLQLNVNKTEILWCSSTRRVVVNTISYPPPFTLVNRHQYLVYADNDAASWRKLFIHLSILRCVGSGFGRLNCLRGRRNGTDAMLFY